MAEQYASFQGRQPDIDVNLFTNARTQGIAAGNAQKTTVSAIAQGITAGIGGGVKTQQGLASIEQTRAQTKLAEAQTAATEQKTAGGGADPQEVLKNQEAQKKIDAGKVISEFGGMLDSALGGNQIDVNSAAASSAFLQAGLMYPNEAMAQLKRAQDMQLLDPAVVTSVGKQLFAATNEKQAQENKIKLDQDYAAAAQKQRADILNATADFSPYIKGNPSINPDNLMLVHPSQIDVGANNSVTKQRDGTFIKPLKKEYANIEDYALLERSQVETGDAYKVLGTGLKKNMQDSLAVLQRGYALEKRSEPPTLAGITESELTKRQPVDTSNNTAMGLAARSAAAVDTGPVTANTIEGRAQAAIKAADAGINKLLAESPTNSAKEAILRGKKLGQDIANKARNTAASFQPTTVPLPQNSAYITRASFNPGEVMKSTVGSIQYAKDHLANIIPGAEVEINLPEKYITRKGTADSVVIEPKIIERIKNDPLYKGLPAKVLGMIAIESGGNPAAYNKGTGAAGAMQLLPGAAIDGGIDPSLENRLNPEENIKGGTAYLQRIGADIAATYTKKVKELQQNSLALGAFASRNGHIQKLDPRVELLAYNGGASYVKAAIRAGKLSWDEIEQHIRDVKHTAAEEENIGYANKVIAASLFFIEGGNTSDEAYVNELRHSGIISVNPKKPAGTYV